MRQTQDEARNIATMSNETTAAIIFVDLAGFTALTEAHGDDDAADLAERFAELTRSVLDCSDRLVKTIGDAVMVASSTALSGITFIDRMVTACATITPFPAIRIGAHAGPVVIRANDMFGSTVNIAARVAAAAAGGETLVTGPMAEAATSAGFAVNGRGAMSFRNVAAPIDIFQVALADSPAGELHIDPVCRMDIDPLLAAGRLRHEDADYLFCSLRCAAAFAAAPNRYARPAH